MTKAYPTDELKQKIDSAQRAVIFIPAKPAFDQVAAALSLVLALDQFGKNISVVSPSPMTVEFNHLVGVDRISGKVQGGSLVVSFDYPADQVEKVSYNDDNGRPNLIIQPKTGSPVITEKMAIYSYAGTEADIVFTLGAKDLSEINLNGQDLTNNFIVNIANRANPGFGQINIVDTEASSLSEVVLGIIGGLNLALDADLAQNLFDGIWRETESLSQPNVGADTYEAVAICLRSGAKKEEALSPKKAAKPLEAKPKSTNPPADWFEPKIFKGTNIA